MFGCSRCAPQRGRIVQVRFEDKLPAGPAILDVNEEYEPGDLALSTLVFVDAIDDDRYIL